MSSKSLSPFSVFKMMAATLSLALISSCALHEGPPPEKKKNLNSNLACLSKMQGKLVDFVNGELKKPEDIDALVKCGSDALTTFKNRTHGLKKNKFTSSEIRNFLQRYFLEDFKITDALLLESMRVKQALIGGGHDEFSIDDIDYGIGVMKKVAEILKILQPHMPLGLKHFEAMKQKDLDSVILDLDRAADQFAEIITEKGITYSFSDFERFLGELITQFPNAKLLPKVREHLDLAASFKALLISPDLSRDELGPHDWKILLEDGARWMGVMLKVVHLNKNSTDLMRGASRDRLSAIADEALGLMGRMVGRHKGTIRFKLINELIDQLPWDGKVGTYAIQKSTLKKTLRAIVLHALSEQDLTVSGRAATGITTRHLKNLNGLIDEIIAGAAFVENVYATQTGELNFLSSATIPQDLIGKLTDTQIEEIARRTGGGPAVALAGRSLRATYAEVPALLAGDSSEIIFSADLNRRARSYRDAFNGVWLKPVFKRLLRGYLSMGVGPTAVATFQDRGLECWEKKTPAGKTCVPSGLTQAEFTAFNREFWPVMLDFKFVWTTSNVERDSTKRFMEASLFTPVSNGDELISMDEGLAMLMYMISAKPLGTKLHDAAAAQCKNGPLDESGRPSIEPRCYRRVVYDFSTQNSLSKSLWGTMPLFMKYYDGLKSDEREDLRKLIEEPIRKEGYQPDLWFDSSASDTIAMMFHYIEAVFTRYDTDQSLTLSRKEAMAAFPVFRRVLSGIAELDEDSGMLKDVFTWLLAKGRNPVDPEAKGVGKLIKSVPFLWWAARNPKFEAPRGNLLSIFGQIGKMASSASTTPAHGPTPVPTPDPDLEEHDEAELP